MMVSPNNMDLLEWSRLVNSITGNTAANTAVSRNQSHTLGGLHSPISDEQLSQIAQSHLNEMSAAALLTSCSSSSSSSSSSSLAHYHLQQQQQMMSLSAAIHYEHTQHMMATTSHTSSKPEGSKSFTS